MKCLLICFPPAFRQLLYFFSLFTDEKWVLLLRVLWCCVGRGVKDKDLVLPTESLVVRQIDDHREIKKLKSLNHSYKEANTLNTSFSHPVQWPNHLVSDNRKYICSCRLYTCINTRKFKGLDSREIIHYRYRISLALLSLRKNGDYLWSREITSLPEIKKSDLHGKSFQSLPKIYRLLITSHLQTMKVYNTRPSQFC